MFGFNHYLDLLHSTANQTPNETAVVDAGGRYHIGIQEPISLSGRHLLNNQENFLSVVDVPENEVDKYKNMVAYLGDQLVFSRNDGSQDVAVFSTESVQKLAMLLRQQEPLQDTPETGSDMLQRYSQET